MAHIIADRVKETSTTEGTGNFTLGGATTGSVTFNAAMANNDTCDYCIEGLNPDGTLSGQWEVGTGTYTDTDTLVRTSVTASSNSGSLVNFSAGTKNVFMALTASRFSDAGTPQYGTFTPTIVGTTSAGTGTYTTQTGSYCKIGRLVYFRASVTITAHTGTGNIQINGLPYICEANSTPISIRAESLTFSNQLTARVVASTTTVQLETISSGGAYAGVPMDTAFGCMIAGSYLTT